MAALHHPHEASQTRSAVFSAFVLLLAALCGLAVGLAGAMSPELRKLLGQNESYPLRMPLTSSFGPSPLAVEPEVDAAGNSAEDGPAPTTSSPPGEVNTAPESVSPQASTNTKPQPSRIGPGGVLSLDYDLARYASSTGNYSVAAGSIETTMPLVVDGVAKGPAQIRVADNAQILISAGAVSRAIGARRNSLPPSLASKLEAGSGFLPFHELRTAGIDVKYDATKDQIALKLPS